MILKSARKADCGKIDPQCITLLHVIFVSVWSVLI